LTLDHPEREEQVDSEVTVNFQRLVGVHDGLCVSGMPEELHQATDKG